MAKDPAFLFYSADFLNGVADLTMEERGQYITLLCLQHQKGPLSEKTIRLNLGSVSVDVISKFEKDEDGNYFNERLGDEIEKRVKFTESRRNNGSKGGRPKASAKPLGLAKNNHIEDVNENVNSNVNNTNTNVIIHEQRKPKQIEVTCFDDFLDKNCPTLRKLKIQMTAQQAEQLMSEFGADACLQIFEAMENWVPLTKKSKSVYLTAKNWLSKRQTTAANGKPAKPTFTQAATNWLDQTSRGSVFGS